MKAIKMTDLHAVANRINQILDTPRTAWDHSKDGKMSVSNVGNYHVHEGFKCFELHRIANECGGVSLVIWARTKRELYLQMHAFIQGAAEMSQKVKA